MRLSLRSVASGFAPVVILQPQSHPIHGTPSPQWIQDGNAGSSRSMNHDVSADVIALYVHDDRRPVSAGRSLLHNPAGSPSNLTINRSTGIGTFATCLYHCTQRFAYS